MNFKQIIINITLSLLIVQPLFSQTDYIYSKEGKPSLNRRDMIFNCLRSLHTDRSNQDALSICECQVNKLDGYFTNKQYKTVTRNHIIDVESLLKLDKSFEKEFQNCYTGSNQTIFLSAQGFSEEMIEKCKENILKSSKDVDPKKITSFCTCQLELIRNKKITDIEMESINDPNSILFYQVMSTCGDPFNNEEHFKSEWSASSAKDINGPEKDTVRMLSLNGMHYVKIKVGSVVYFWLLDTGASDMLITKDLEQKLLDENFLSLNNYLGTGKYEMANGETDTCRKYKIENIQIGHSSIANMIIAVSDKAKRVIAGKSILNKFSNWMIDNKENILVVSK